QSGHNRAYPTSEQGGRQPEDLISDQGPHFTRSAGAQRNKRKARHRLGEPFRSVPFFPRGQAKAGSEGALWVGLRMTGKMNGTAVRQEAAHPLPCRRATYKKVPEEKRAAHAVPFELGVRKNLGSFRNYQSAAKATPARLRLMEQQGGAKGIDDFMRFD